MYVQTFSIYGVYISPQRVTEELAWKYETDIAERDGGEIDRQIHGCPQAWQGGGHSHPWKCYKVFCALVVTVKPYM